MSFLLLLLCATLSAAATTASQPAVVIVPVADVWSRPLADDEKPADDLRETQVLLGEHVRIHESSGTWARIEAVEQPEFTHHNAWEGYPGWVRASELSFPAKPSGKHPQRLSRAQLVELAEQSIGTTYVWGGMSLKSLDCSGLIHLVFRTGGIQIPRDAYEQWMKARPITRAELKPADLIFSAKAATPKKITHVALYAGDGQIIEAPQTGMTVRKVSFEEKYGKAFDQVESGDTVNDRVVYFGTFFKK